MLPPEIQFLVEDRRRKSLQVPYEHRVPIDVIYYIAELYDEVAGTRPLAGTT